MVTPSAPPQLPPDDKPTASQPDTTSSGDVRENTPLDPAIVPAIDPAQTDAEWTRRWLPLGFVSKLVLWVLLLLAAIVAGLYYAAGTPWGTRVIVNAVVQQTGISLKLGEGNLREGLWIYDLHIPPRPPKSNIEVNVDKAFIQMGWRAVFYKEVHLRDAKIDNLTIYNHTPATGEPFKYDRIALPVNLRIDHATANLIRYQQAPQTTPAIVAAATAVDKIATAASHVSATPSNNTATSSSNNSAVQVNTSAVPNQAEPLTIDFKQDDITDFTWVGSELTVKQANLYYNELLQISQLAGTIDLQNDYPLNATANVVINSLSKVYIDALDVHATGSLKNLSATVKSRYNTSAIEGTLTAQPMEKNAPFDANVTWQDVQLPYAKSQNIHLKKGALHASGLTNNILLKVDTDLTAKNIPDGHYRGTAQTDGKTMKIERLLIDLPEGQLVTQGVLDWQGRFNMALMNEGHGFKIRKLLDDSYRDYAPETLNGKLAIVYRQADANNPMDIRANLKQNDGETITAHILQDQSSKKLPNPPTKVHAVWRHYIRHDVPNVGEIDSPHGQADVIVEKIDKEQHVSVMGKANIVKLNAAPQGDYDVNLKKHGKIIDINQLIYRGVIGDLSGKGQIQLAQKDQPLTWQLDAKTNTLNAHDFNKSIPFSRLSGTLNATGKMINSQQKDGKKRTQHDITIKDINMAGTLTDSSNRKGRDIKVVGAGTTRIDLLNNQLQNFAVTFDGNLAASQVFARANKNTQQTANNNANAGLDGQFNIDIHGTPKHILINRFEHHSKLGAINAKGKVDLTHGIGWQVNADMKQFDASYFVPSLPSQITGHISSDGNWQDDTQTIHIDQMNLQGRLRNQPLVATGTLKAKLHLPKDLSSLARNFSQANATNPNHTATLRQVIDSLDANNLKLVWGDNAIVVNGTQNQLVSSISVSNLSQLMPNLKGNLKGGIILSQSPHQSFPDAYVDIIGHDIRVPNFAVLDVKVIGKLVDMAKSPSQLQLQATGLNISNQTIRAVQVDFAGTQADHWLNLKTENSKGQLQASLKGAIDFNQKHWQGVLGNAQLGTKYAQLQQIQPAQMAINWENPKLELAAHCWQMVGQTGRLCFKDNLVMSQNSGQINASLQQIDSQIFSVFMPKDLAWKGEVNGDALVHWQKGQHPVVNASLYTDNGVIGMTPDSVDDNPMTLDYDRISLIARSTAEGLKLRGDIKTSNGTGSGYIDATIDPYGVQKPIGGTVVLQDINLAILKPFLPSFQRLSGNAVVAGKIAGTLNQPKFTGDIEVNQGAVSVIGLPMKLSDINVLTHVEGNQAQINGTFASAGRGKGTLAGTVDWTKSLQANLKVQGTNLQVSQPPLIFAEINPMFDIVVRPQQRYVNIEGVVDVPRATIRPPESTKNVISKSPDVTVIDRRLAGQINDVLKVVQPWSINADIAVDLGNRVFFRGFGANLPLAGALHITERGQGGLKAQGVVQVAKRSKVDIFGQSLNVNYAQIRFDGMLGKPTLNMEAVKEIQGVTVGVRVKGESSSPNITVFNNGGLSDQQAMNALVTGSLNNTTGQSTNTEDFKSRVNNTLAAAGLSYGLQGTRQFTNQIGRAFGLQSLTLDAAGTGSDTEVNLTGYITPDLYIRYGVGVFNSTNTLSMRYQLTRRLYIEAKSAVNNSVDILYNWKF